MPRIVLKLDGRPLRSVTLNAGSTSIGRAGDNDIVLDNERVSRYHARIDGIAKSYVLHDLGSTNGVRVNGDLLSGPRDLCHGDRIHLSGVDQSIELVFDADLETINDRDKLPLRNGRLTITISPGEVVIDGRGVPLTQREQRALELLLKHAGTTVTKDQLAHHVWPEDDGVISDSSIEVLISRLRPKIAPLQIANVRGVGYRLQID